MASARQRGARRTGLYRGADGNQKSAGTFETEEEALARAKVKELDARPPQAVEVYAEHRRGRITVAAYAPRWLDGLRREPNTILAYGLSLKHIVRVIGSMAVAEVQPRDIVRIIRAMEKLGRADSTIRHAVVVAKLMFGSAVKDGLRDNNPCDDDDTRVKVRDQREMLIATREQAKAIVTAARRLPDERSNTCRRLDYAVLAQYPERLADRVDGHAHVLG